MEQSKFAIIDIGSNTVRLVIYNTIRLDVMDEIENVKVSLRLSQYVDEKQVLSHTGIERLIEVLHSFEEVIQFHEVEETDCTATAAIRNAANRDEIIKHINSRTSFEVRLLSGEEEAYYGFLAIKHTLPVSDGITVDLGGGSTEITLFNDRKLIRSVSLPFGVVSLKKRFSDGTPMSHDARNRMIDYIREQLYTLDWIKEGVSTIVGIGGSIRSLSGYSQLKTNYPAIGLHGFVMQEGEMKDIYEELKDMPAQQIEALAKDRADLAIPALAVFLSIMEQTKSQHIICCTKGLRDGIVLAKVCDSEKLDIRSIQRHGIRRLMMTHDFDTPDRYHTAENALQILKKIAYHSDKQLSQKQMDLVYNAALLFNAGESISRSLTSRNTFDLLTTLPIDGFLHKEKAFLALTASFTNNSTLKDFAAFFDSWFSEEELKIIRIAGSVFKLSFHLNITKRNTITFKCMESENETLTLYFSVNGLSLVEKLQAEKQKKHLEKSLNRQIQLKYE